MSPKANPTSLLFASASSQYVSIADNAALRITGALTIEADVKPSDSVPNKNMVVLSKGNQLAAANMDYTLTVNNRKARVIVSNGTSTIDLTSNATLPDGHWSHIALVYSPSTYVKIYINGVLDTNYTSGIISSIQSTTHALGIARDGTNAGTYLNGNINNVRLWNVARTQAQIQDFTKDVTSDTGLVAWWRFKDGSGTTLTDVIGGYNGTLNASPTWSNDVPFTVHESTANTVEAGSGRFNIDSRRAAYYKLEDTSDSSGNSHTLTNNNSVTFTAGKFNNAADFGTSNTNKSLSVANNLGVSGTNHAATISFWAKMNTEISSSYQGFCQLEESSTKTLFQVYYDYNAGTRRIAFNRQTIGVANNLIYSTLTLGTTDWYHIALTYDGTTMFAYVNGFCVGTLATSGSGSISLGDNFIIGNCDTAQYISAKIDDMQVFPFALSDADVMDIYVGKRVSPPEFSTLSLASDANLVSYYKLENTSDSKGTNTLTNNNSVTFSAAKFNNGANLGSSNTNKYLSVSSNLGIDLTSDFTFSLWVKVLAEPPTSGEYDFIELDSTITSTRMARLFYQTNGSGVHILQFDSGEGAATFNVALGTSSLHHLVGIQKGTAIFLFFDGVLVGMSTRGSTSFNALNSLMFGRSNQFSNYASALLDDAPIFNRALTPDEAATIFYGIGGTVYTKTFVDSMTMSDSITRSIARTLMDTITISDLIKRVITKQFTDSIISSDAITKSITKMLGDTMTISDNINKLIGKVFVDSLTITDTISKAITKTFVDTMTITDIFTKLVAGFIIKAPTAFTKYYQALGSSKQYTPVANANTKPPQGG